MQVNVCMSKVLLRVQKVLEFHKNLNWNADPERYYEYKMKTYSLQEISNFENK